ncbi:MAG: DegV family protein [Mycoplasmataceae bacterium]|jgi:DegV family protein with EDD domain|nr:DegV family protein [Mycoplasmataceae bacterium]
MSNKIGILIDSSSTFNDGFIKSNNIEIIPLSLTDNNNKVYDDLTDISHEDLLKRLDNGEDFKTSCSQLGKLFNKVDEMLKKYEQVVFLPISMGLSSQYNQSLMVQQEYPNKFFVIKSTSAALANEFILKHLVDDIKKNLDINQIINHAENNYNRICTYFSCEDLSGMIKGGRATKAVMHVIKFLHLKPIIQLDNKNQYGGVGRDYQHIIKKIIKNIHKDFNEDLTPDKIINIGIYQAGYDKTKEDYILNEISNSFNYPKEKILIRFIPNCVLCHTHRGAYGISIETSLLRKNKEYK